MRRVIIAGAVLVVLATSVYAADPLRVMVSIPPQKYFVEQIGGDRVSVEVMVPPGSDPHTYEPRPASRAALERAQVYFAIGDAFEQVWLGRMAGDSHGPRVVRTDEGIAKLGPASTDGSGSDPHIWLSPPLVKIQAQRTRDGLIAADPDGRRYYSQNYERFAQELDRFDRELTALFKGVKSREFFVLHPAWAYFASAYGLTQMAIEVDGKNPTPAQMQRLIAGMKSRQVKVIFAQPQRSQRMAEIIAAEVGARVVLADDLSSDWERNLRQVAIAVRGALTGDKP